MIWMAGEEPAIHIVDVYGFPKNEHVILYHVMPFGPYHVHMIDIMLCHFGSNLA